MSEAITLLYLTFFSKKKFKYCIYYYYFENITTKTLATYQIKVTVREKKIVICKNFVKHKNKNSEFIDVRWKISILFLLPQVAPYKVTFEEEDEDWDTSKGVRVMAVAYVPDYTQSAFACIAAPDGDITDYLRLPHLLKRKNSFREDEKMMKVRSQNGH